MSFNDRNAELDKDDVFKVSNIQQSIEYLNVGKFYGWYTPNGHQIVDIISRKRDIFGYIDNYATGEPSSFTPAPNGSGEMLNADEAFNAKLGYYLK
ncbi:hypothetical protein OK016_12625 [Vibrio chagasii]|nr:hypothetical protein [Vibrio chagasii]